MITKKIFTCLLVSFIAITLFGCEKAGETVSEETTVPETTAVTLSEEELDKMAENMPEIVFVMSHHYDDTNILGFYITNTGEMKMYDFRNIAPDEIYEVPDVYDRLEEATCSELDFRGGFGNSENITENDMVSVSEDELSEYYKKLLLATGNVEYIDLVAITMDIGNYMYYGIKNTANGEKECVLLFGQGVGYKYESEDVYVEEVAHYIWRLFPDYFIYNN